MTDTGLNDHKLAWQWRTAMGLTRTALSDLTGYSPQSIAAYERGRQGDGKPIDPDTMKRYALACAAVTAGLDFDWREVRFEVVRRDVVRMPAAKG